MSVRRPITRAVSPLRVVSRAIIGLMSVGDWVSARRKTLSISAPGLASAGDLVANGPLMTTPISFPDGITRPPGLACRVRSGLAKLSWSTTVQPRVSTAPIRVLPLRSRAASVPARGWADPSPTLPDALRVPGMTSRRGGCPDPPPPPGCGGRWYGGR